MINLIKNLQDDKQTLRKFGLTSSIALIVIAAIVYWRKDLLGLPLIVTATALTLTALIVPRVLKYVYYVWMSVAMILQFIVTHIILTLLFFLVFTPVGLIKRTFGRDSMSRRFDPEVRSYWIEKEHEELNKTRYEQQF